MKSIDTKLRIFSEQAYNGVVKAVLQSFKSAQDVGQVNTKRLNMRKSKALNLSVPIPENSADFSNSSDDYLIPQLTAKCSGTQKSKKQKPECRIIPSTIHSEDEPLLSPSELPQPESPDISSPEL